MIKGNPKPYIDKYYPVLDHGFVALTNYMGGDREIEQAARVSYGAGTRSVRKTRGLIRYLMRHYHTTPIEQVELKFHIAMPIFVQRQFIRHRTLSVNEHSGRYSKMPVAFYKPERSRYGAQSKSNRQGTDEDETPELSFGEFNSDLNEQSLQAFDRYHNYLEADVARELARINLPLNIYTELYFSVDLHNLFHFLNLRMDPHAQWEIRQYAFIIAGLALEVAPLATEAFLDYHLNNYTLSDAEIGALRDICSGGRVSHEELEENGMSAREIREFEDVMFGDREPVTTEDIRLDPEDALTPEQARIRLHGETDE